MRRNLSAREKTLLLILVVLVLVLGYWKLVLEPINSQVERYNAMARDAQMQVDQQMLQLAQMRKMESLLAQMKENGTYLEIPAYDNREAVLVELHRILAAAQDYSLEFAATSQQGKILSRPVVLGFSAKDYPTARAILNQLHNSENFNMISDLSIQWDSDRSQVTVSLCITYYEVAGR